MDMYSETTVNADDLRATPCSETRVDNRHPPQFAFLFDQETFCQFSDLLGKEKAQFWLESFRRGLIEDFAGDTEQPEVPENARVSIHHICARAGLIGFRSLHEACLGFLEAGCSAQAYQRVRAQVGLALPEIERQCAKLI